MMPAMAALWAAKQEKMLNHLMDSTEHDKTKWYSLCCAAIAIRHKSRDSLGFCPQVSHRLSPKEGKYTSLLPMFSALWYGRDCQGGVD